MIEGMLIGLVVVSIVATLPLWLFAGAMVIAAVCAVGFVWALFTHTGLTLAMAGVLAVVWLWGWVIEQVYKFFRNRREAQR